ncbi:MAG: radical SAM family heme chaperone HemW [bacterium]
MGKEGIAVYIHIPFCLKKCDYCDFYSLRYEEGRARAFALALLEEIHSYTNLQAKTIYIGGGTPTSLPTPLLKDIILQAKAHFSLPPQNELTVEANPETLDEKMLQSLKEVGVNRLSIGVQSFNDELLSFLGRVHNADKARWAIRKAKEIGFENINIDLLFAIPRQSLEDWQTTLEEAISYQPTHISCYSLTFEKGTKLYRKLKTGEISPPDEENSALMFEMADEMLTSNRYIHYEISNYALPGYECQHNLSYWRSEPYLGLGPSAVSFLPPYRLRNPTLPKYLNGQKAKLEEIVDEKGRRKEKLMLGLRLREGVAKSLLAAKIPEELIEGGFIEEVGERIRLTLKGMLVYNRIVADLFFGGGDF